MDHATFQERRLTRRALVKSSARCRSGQGEAATHQVANLSVGGALLLGSCELRRGSALRATLSLPERTLCLCAHVVRVQRAPRPAFALAWDWLTPKEEDAIAAAVNTVGWARSVFERARPPSSRARELTSS